MPSLCQKCVTEIWRCKVCGTHGMSRNSDSRKRSYHSMPKQHRPAERGRPLRSVWKRVSKP